MKNKEILKNYLYWFLTFIGCMLVGIIRTYALSFSDFTDVHSNTTLYVGYADSGNPISWPYNNSTLYQSNIISLDYVVNTQIVANTHYEFESHMLGQYLIGTSIYSVVDASGNTCLTDSYYLNFLNGEYPRWDFQCPYNSNGFTIHIQQSNSSRLFNDGYMGWGSAILSKGDTPISSNGNDTEEIINNANANTNQIIDNQNQNTQSIIDGDLNCYGGNHDMYSRLNGKYIQDSNGNTANNSSFSVSQFFYIEQNKNYVINFNNITSLEYGYLCWYNNNNLLSCSQYRNMSGYGSTNFTITAPNNANRLTLTFRNNSNATIRGGSNKLCESKQDETNKIINNIDDTLKDDNIDDNNIASAFEDFNDYLDDNSTITQLLTLPITLFTAILNNVNGTCQPFNLGALYGENLILPCINVSQYLGNTLWSMIDIIISGFAIFAISKKMIKVFNNFSSLKEGDVIDD